MLYASLRPLKLPLTTCEVGVFFPPLNIEKANDPRLSVTDIRLLIVFETKIGPFWDFPNLTVAVPLVSRSVVTSINLLISSITTSLLSSNELLLDPLAANNFLFIFANSVLKVFIEDISIFDCLRIPVFTSSTT